MGEMIDLHLEFRHSADVRIRLGVDTVRLLAECERRLSGAEAAGRRNRPTRVHPAGTGVTDDPLLFPRR